MQSSFSMTFSLSNLPSSTSNRWSNGSGRKRKSGDIDMEEKFDHKIFLTEEKLIRNMQTLSLDLSGNTPLAIAGSSQDDKEEHPAELHLHELLKTNLRKDDLQDTMINRLCDLERKKLAMQIVPYMPIHPAQLSIYHEEEEEEKHPDSSLPIPVDPKSDDDLFKKPFPPTPYFVEEPPENLVKRTTRMKRSYSQSLRSNNNLSVTEIRDDTPTFQSSTDYLIFEPTTPVPFDSPKSNINSSFSINRPSIRITEYFDYPDDIEMKSVNFSDAYETMT